MTTLSMLVSWRHGPDTGANSQWYMASLRHSIKTTRSSPRWPGLIIYDSAVLSNYCLSAVAMAMVYIEMNKTPRLSARAMWPFIIAKWLAPDLVKPVSISSPAARWCRAIIPLLQSVMSGGSQGSGANTTT